MANITLRSKHHTRAFHALGLFCLLLVLQRVNAREFKVGSSNGWAVPTDPNAYAYNKWAETNRFQIGDSLLFVYPADKDSVLQVKKEDYENCNTASPLASFNDGNTSFKFNQSGPYYFISGNADNCLKNEKMIVTVMADRSNKSSNSNNTSLAYPPSLPPSGSTDIIPSPAPVGEEAPSPPAPPPNGASSMFVSVVGSIGAFVGSSLLLVL